MAEKQVYYCVGFNWYGTESINRLQEFLENGYWETGYDEKYYNRVNAVPIGARIAAKTTYTEKHDGRSISMLEIHATGTVVGNPQNGSKLEVRWDPPFDSFKVPGKGAYRTTISRVRNLETIKLIFHRQPQARIYAIDEYRTTEPTYPCFVLIKTSWDDYSHRTSFEVDFYDSARRKFNIGTVKVLQRDNDNTNISEVLRSSDEDYCSLGTNNSYYRRLRDLDKKSLTDQFLEEMNDVAVNGGLLPDFESLSGFKHSLLRNSESQKALREGKRVYEDVEIVNEFNFTFVSQLGGAVEPHSFNFDFRQKDELPYRIKVLIGKNGTGKTTYLANLAATLSGFQSRGHVSTQYLPPFSRILAISYSLFDKFPRPPQTKKYSYYYSGFQGSRSVLNENQIEFRVKRALSRLEKLQRMPIFYRFLSSVLSDELASDLFSDDLNDWTSKNFTVVNGEYSKYSSGQLIMILILSEILSVISENSLLLFDEPETHLHPNSISLFMGVINKVLYTYDSYAIISTHSPQVVQEVPAKDVMVIDRIGDVPSSRPLAIESFGENLNVITEQIFSAINDDEYYRRVLRRLARSNSYEEVLRMFSDSSLPLSLGAKIFLQAQYQ